MAETHYKQELYPLSVVIATLGGETLADTISYLNSGEKIPAEILVCIPEEDSSCAESLSMKNVKIIKTSIINNKHVSAIIKPYIGPSIKSICFNCVNTPIGEHLLFYKKQINIIAEINENIWNNKKNKQLNIKDIIL